MTDAVVRRAAERDLGAILDLLEVVAAEDEFIATESPVDRGEVERSFARTYFAGSTDAAMFVAEVDGVVVGRISLKGADVVSLGMMVAPDRRGRGIGTRLLSEGIRWARASGARAIELDVFPGNERALGLYEKIGFRRRGVLRGRYRRRTGELRDAVLMELDLRG